MTKYGGLGGERIVDRTIPRKIISDTPVACAPWMYDATRRVRFVLEAVGFEMLVDPIDIVAGNNAQYIVEARMVAFWVLRGTTSLSLSEVARRLGRKDHTTVRHGVEQVEERRKRDVDFMKMTDAILSRAKAVREQARLAA